jgi:hypothetical protein
MNGPLVQSDRRARRAATRSGSRSCAIPEESWPQAMRRVIS